jgi:CDP-glucose 4,6-dehydratase
MNRSFWKDKKVFLTGHTGFKGSWLSLWLQSCGSILMGYSLAPNTKLNLFDLALVADGMNSEIGDVRDLERLKKTMKYFSPEIVIHMAAQPLVRTSYKDPVDTYSTNVMGTVNLLESIRNINSVKAVVNVTSDKCYENNERTLGYREDEPMGGKDPYSNSKGCSELVTKAFRNSFFCDLGSAKIASVRAGNVIGGGDWADDRLIPDIFKSFQEKKPVLIRNPDAIRPWQHVLEPLSGYLLLLERLYIEGNKFADGWNFGPKNDDVKPVNEIVEYLIEKWGHKEGYIKDISVQPHEAQLLRLDISKAKDKLGWEPKWDLYKSLDSIVDWYKALLNNKDIRALTLNQINQFEEC